MGGIAYGIGSTMAQLGTAIQKAKENAERLRREQEERKRTEAETEEIKSRGKNPTLQNVNGRWVLVYPDGRIKPVDIPGSSQESLLRQLDAISDSGIRERAKSYVVTLMEFGRYDDAQRFVDKIMGEQFTGEMYGLRSEGKVKARVTALDPKTGQAVRLQLDEYGKQIGPAIPLPPGAVRITERSHMEIITLADGTKQQMMVVDETVSGPAGAYPGMPQQVPGAGGPPALGQIGLPAGPRPLGGRAPLPLPQAPQGVPPPARPTPQASATPIGVPFGPKKQPGAPGGGGFTREDAVRNAEGIIAGRLPPVVTGFGSPKFVVLSELEKRGYNLARAELDWRAIQRYLASLNGPQQLRLRQAIEFVNGHLPLLEQLYSEWQETKLPGGFKLYNKAALTAAANLPGKAGAVATALRQQINDFTAEMAYVYRGGNASTDDSLQLAAQNLQGDWNKETFDKAIKTLKQVLIIRRNSISAPGVAGVSEGSPYLQPPGPVPPPNPPNQGTRGVPPPLPLGGSTGKDPFGLGL